MLFLRISFASLFLLSLLPHLHAQSPPPEPAILILSPFKTTAHKHFDPEIAEITADINESRDANIQQSVDQLKYVTGERPGIRTILEKDIEFDREATAENVIAGYVAEYLQYTFFERFPNLLIYPVPTRSKGESSELAQLAVTHGMRYVLNFLEVNMQYADSKASATLQVQLYDRQQDGILYQKSYTGSSSNPGGPFGCKEGSLQCCLNNAMSEALDDLIRTVVANNGTLSRERKLDEARTLALVEEWFPKTPNKKVADLAAQELEIPEKGFFQGLMDASEEKLIGFYAQSAAEAQADPMKGQDRHVNIISADGEAFGMTPGYYGFVVVGVLHEGEWFLQKRQVTYFDAENLKEAQQKYFQKLKDWELFEENSASYAPEFWNRGFFRRVSSKVEENAATIANYKENIAAETDPETKEILQQMVNEFYEADAQNKAYVGMYEIVVAEKRAQVRMENEKFEAKMDSTRWTPFFEQYLKQHGDQYVEIGRLNAKEIPQIYPTSRNLILAPIALVAADGSRDLRFFVQLQAQTDYPIFYEWTYFPPILNLEGWHYGSDVVEQLSKVTIWNFAFETLDDTSFWQEYVLKKEDGKYLYLKPWN